ncbi:MAG: carbamoyltransferase HypF [Rhodospirillaceae bacterium]
MPGSLYPGPRRLRIRVCGQVQGVGFRPFVYGLAGRLGLAGSVHNDGGGVVLEIEGAEPALAAFHEALRSEPPALARITGIESTEIPVTGDAGFVIQASERGAAMLTVIPADAAVCEACLAEMFDPTDRRYRYPFLNCTQCGPRYTITRRLPYDRPQTSMAGFALCPACAAEYADPADRRFHAQPTCCPVCGPRLSHAIEDILAELAAGRIVGLKGLGGFHLACDARNAEAVARLRALKQRDGKPFAVMVETLADAERLVEISPVEAALLKSAARPVVLLKKRAGADQLAASVAPDLAWLGVMLPYTPLHYLLLHEATGAQPAVLVMTSANPGGEPLAIDNDEAARRLAGIADLIVDHDRAIVIRADDSVMRVIAGAPCPIRRARGLVPDPIALSRPVPSVLAVGGHLKNAVCVTRGDQAFLSQHIGDLDNAATLGFFEETVRHLLDILEVRPVVIARDLHPDFLSSRFAETLAAELGVPCLAIQHHHAHVAAVAAEHACEAGAASERGLSESLRTGVSKPTLGLALDGFGLGESGDARGGELLRLEGAEYRRIGRLAALAQPGGDLAARQPWRMAAAALHRMGRRDEIASRLSRHGPAAALVQLLDKGLNAPPTSSCGRWFDAACGLLGVRPKAGFEGEAPMVLESLVRKARVVPGLWRISPDHAELDLLPLLESLLEVEDAAVGAELFHGTLAAALVDWTVPVVAGEGLDRVVLAGGCLNNRVLAEGLVAGFAGQGITALLARQAPPGDGGLALGQAVIAARTVC